MCGRFTQKSERKIISIEFFVDDFRSDVFINYNVSPGQDAGVILYDSGYCYDRYRWGLIPSWAKDPTIGNRMINARAETISEKPAFRKAFMQRRCLIPADGFFEWKKLDGRKIPYYIFSSSGKPMSFAGLWESWYPVEIRYHGSAEAPEEKEEKKRGIAKPSYHRGAETHARYDNMKPLSEYPSKQKPLHTFTIITTQANERLKELHDRMPVIIPPDKRELWLNPAIKDINLLLDLLIPLPEKELDFYEVSRIVNSPENNSPECIIPHNRGIQ
jgi:putative SOS response-associated peptidase YedK